MGMLAKLPDDILRVVFQDVAFDPRSRTYSWDNVTAPLAVCRRWRALTLPIAYSHIFIDIERTAEHGHGIQTRAGAGRVHQPGSLITSNIGLVDALGLRHLPKSLYIHDFEYYSLRRNFGVMFGLLLFAMSTPWENIHSISIYYHLDDFVGNRVGDEPRLAAMLDSYASVLADFLAKGAPNTEELAFENIYSSARHRVIEGKIINTFATQLRSLRVATALPRLNCAFSPALTRLTFCMDSSNPSLAALPHVHAQSIQYLHIAEITDQFSWGVLVNGTERDSIDKYLYEDVAFSCLKQLILDYNVASNDSSRETAVSNHDQASIQRHKLRFPRLLHLALYSFPANFSFFKHAELPSKLLSLEIIGTGETVEPLMESKLPDADVLRLGLGGRPQEEDWENENIIATNFLQRHHGSKSTIVSLSTGHNYSLGSQVMKHARITEFTVGAPMAVANMLHFLFHMPDLDTLCVCISSFHSMPACVQDYDGSHEENNRQPPTFRHPNSKVRKIMVRDICQGAPSVEQNRLMLANCLVAMFPTLQILKFKYLDDSAITQIFQTYRC